MQRGNALLTSNEISKGAGDHLPQACMRPNAETIAASCSASLSRLESTSRSGVAVRLAASVAACFSKYSSTRIAISSTDRARLGHSSILRERRSANRHEW